jgi:ketosteroid isomerase-like protein
MSQENVAIIQRLHGAFSRRDFDGALQQLHADFELFPAIAGPDYDTHYRGRERAKEFFEVITEVWETVTVEFEETIEAPQNRIVAVERWCSTGRDGIEIDFQLIEVYAFRDGLVLRIDGFLDKADALEAAGLSS